MLKHWKWRQTTKYQKNVHSFCSSLTFLNIARLVFVYLHSVVKHCPFPVFMYPNKHYILTSHLTMSICFHYTMYMYKLFFKSRNVNFPHPCCSRWNCWISAQSATCTCVLPLVSFYPTSTDIYIFNIIFNKKTPMITKTQVKTVDTLV